MPADAKAILEEPEISALRDGHYNLLLGAGASAGARSADGRDLPLGEKFGEELVSRFSLNVKAGTPLQNIWEAASLKAGSEKALRAAALQPRFSGCTPAPYHGLFSTFAWKRIFSFNVDDVLNTAYSSVGGRIQALAEVHFEDPYLDPELAADRVQLIYLHGSASLPDRIVVFSPPAYADAIKDQNTWFHVFAGAFRSEPFIVIGATLREADFEAYLAQKKRYPNPLAPRSLYIDPSIDDAGRAICARLGLLPIEATGEDFLKQISDLVTGRERISARLARDLKPLTVLGAVENLPQLAAVAQQFTLLPRESSKWPSLPRPAETFYEGNDATWDDVRAGRDVALRVEADITGRIRAFLDSAAQPNLQVAVISDGAGTGKTTVAMRVAATLALEGRAVLFLSGTDRLRDEALLAVLSRESSPVVLVVDRLGDHSIPLARLCSAYPKGAARCFILGIERRSSEHLIRERLREQAPVFMTVPRLIRPEAEDLARKLRAVAKLGKYSGKSEVELADLFVGTDERAWGGQLLVILLEVTQERKLAERLAGEWRDLPGDARAFYGAICIASACGFPLRSARAFATVEFGSASEFGSAVIDGALKGLIRWESVSGEYYIKPRHRVVAEEVVQAIMSESEVFEVSRSLAAALAPFVNRRTIMSGSPDSRLMRQLMDEDGAIVPRFRARAEDWFGTLQPLCDWNSRFWEQRALNAMRSGNRKRARDFASTGVGIEQHWQPMTTYARVLIDSAQNEARLRIGEREDFLREGVFMLDEAIKLAARGRRDDVHPYHLLLDVSVRVGRELLGNLADWHVTVVADHAPTAEELFGHREDMRKALDRLRRLRVI
jgi:SIR2-like protein